MSQAVVFIVATPIGNLDDMTPRAVATLRNVDVIAAEDTRVTRKLLSHFNITGKDVISYHDHGEEGKAEYLINKIEDKGLSIALVSDAGTPCIADPGYRLVRLAKSRGIPVHPIPGASALTSLVSVSGLPSHRFVFVGFLPTKAKELRAEVESWIKCAGSVIFFEPTRRLKDSLKVIGEVYPQAEVAIGRELTKMFEEIVTLPVPEALAWIEGHAVLKGEAAVMVDLKVDRSYADSADEMTGESVRQAIIAAARRGFANGQSLKDLLKEFGGSGLSRSELYQLLLEVKETLA